MHSRISLYLSSGKNQLCAFADIKKAFDTVWRIGLWQKLTKNKICGKMFRVIWVSFIFVNWIHIPYKPRIWYYLRAEDQVE
jgi:hypothetical protein